MIATLNNHEGLLLITDSSS